ncbi:uncharacterized protein LOC143637030 isoform X2 [Bidens hawaiensis]|uniref:uncharacterized protein LOC143637030 isoform X2 n=1 Tax=Bidens hawaiensis TaxID=980011 RepID=UPI00404BA2B6
MKGSLSGFHPPHFSEEEAWLPAWLHPCNQPTSTPSQDIGHLQENIVPTQNGNLSNDSTCKSLHLFLSGDDDNSPMSFPSSSTNHQVQYRPRLSSTEESQYSLNPTLSKSKGIPDEGKLIITHPKSSTFKEQTEANAKVDATCQETDISDAIELAVAASEALTIHKVLKDELIIPSSVLEAAVRLKQARLENSRENLGNSLEESGEVDFDFFSDLDYLTMADAYEDVGLTVANHGDPSAYCSVSHVNDTFGSENYTSNAKHEGNILSKGFVLESCEHVTRKERVDYESLGAGNADLACDVDPVFNCSVEQADFCATEAS